MADCSARHAALGFLSESIAFWITSLYNQKTEKVYKRICNKMLREPTMPTYSYGRIGVLSENLEKCGIDPQIRAEIMAGGERDLRERHFVSDGWTPILIFGSQFYFNLV